MTAAPCPSCRTRRRSPGQYLCFDCWNSLPTTTRRALNRRDTRAMTRLRELHDQLAADVPLDQIQVSP